MNTCKLCNMPRPSIFTITLPGDDGDFSETVKVCGLCIDIISQLAIRATQNELSSLSSRLARLEVYTGIVVPNPLSETPPARPAFVERVLGSDEEMREGDRVYSRGEYAFSISGGWDGDTVESHLHEADMEWSVTRREPTPLWDEPTPEEVASFWGSEGRTRFVDGAPDEQSRGDGQRLEDVF